MLTPPRRLTPGARDAGLAGRPRRARLWRSSSGKARSRRHVPHFWAAWSSAPRREPRPRGRSRARAPARPPVPPDVPHAPRRDQVATPEQADQHIVTAAARVALLVGGTASAILAVGEMPEPRRRAAGATGPRRGPLRSAPRRRAGPHRSPARQVVDPAVAVAVEREERVVPAGPRGLLRQTAAVQVEVRPRVGQRRELDAVREAAADDPGRVATVVTRSLHPSGRRRGIRSRQAGARVDRRCRAARGRPVTIRTWRPARPGARARLPPPAPPSRAPRPCR